MKKMLLISVIVAAIAVPAMASLQVRVDYGPLGTGAGNGGAFAVTVTQGPVWFHPTGSTFLTFCMEYTESVNYGSTYYVDVTNSANEGGPPVGLDPLDAKTAALYVQWLGLSNPGDTLSDKYQLAMWQLEDEVEYKAGQWVVKGTSNLIHGAYQSFTTTDVNNLIATVGSPASIGNVRVLNLWNYSNSTGYAQDLLVWVPAPAAAGLAFLGLGMLGWVKRRIA